MPDLAALRAELDKPAYAGLSHAQAAVAVMAATVSANRQLPSAEVARFWARRGVLANAREAGERDANPAARTLGWRVLDVVSFDVLGELDTRDAADRADFSTLMDSMVTAGIMTGPIRAATIALISKPRLGREVFGVIDENDIAQARAL